MGTLPASGRSNPGDRTNAQAVFWQLLKRPDLTLHQLAVTTSTLSDIYITNGQPDTAIILLIRAAIADIQSSTKETAAIFNLAQLLYKKGDVRNASSYIEIAIRDAIFYGARQRKVQVSAILPLIEGEKISRVEEQKTIFVTWSIIATLLLLAVIALVIIVSPPGQPSQRPRSGSSPKHTSRNKPPTNASSRQTTNSQKPIRSKKNTSAFSSTPTPSRSTRSENSKNRSNKRSPIANGMTSSRW